MPANLTPEYKAAEAAFRKTRDPKERLDWLREMLRTIPKHKGTDHLQADIKSRIKQLTEELTSPKKGGARGGPATVIRPEGAAQIALIGSPNVGKSSLHARLSGSNAEIGPYPYTTQFPQPGMMPYQDIYLQLIDLPPISAEHPIPWIGNTLHPADANLLVVDLTDPDCIEQAKTLHELLAQKRITLTGHWQSPVDERIETEDTAGDDPFAIHLPTLMLLSKADLIANLEEELQVFRELTEFAYPALAVSIMTEQGLEELGPWLFHRLGIVRVYTKAPGQRPDKNRPFTVRRGATVEDVAVQVHKEIAEGLKYARLWGGGQFDGQQVGRDHALTDGDILEFHS